MCRTLAILVLVSSVETASAQVVFLQPVAPAWTVPVPVIRYYQAPVTSYYVPARRAYAPRLQIERYYFEPSSRPARLYVPPVNSTESKRSQATRTIIREYYYWDPASAPDQGPSSGSSDKDKPSPPKKLHPPRAEEVVEDDAAKADGEAEQEKEKMAEEAEAKAAKKSEQSEESAAAESSKQQ